MPITRLLECKKILILRRRIPGERETNAHRLPHCLHHYTLSTTEKCLLVLNFCWLFIEYKFLKYFSCFSCLIKYFENRFSFFFKYLLNNFHLSTINIRGEKTFSGGQRLQMHSQVSKGKSIQLIIILKLFTFKSGVKKRNEIAEIFVLSQWKF